MAIQKKILDKVSRLVPSILRNHILKGYEFVNISYSQEGEDIVLGRIFDLSKPGFYIDIGAHHPKRFSNTFLFYSRGWSGINVDANPGVMREFDLLRPRDINIECGVSNDGLELDYHMFDESALNTFSAKEAEKKSKLGFEIIGTKKIKTESLENILDNHLPSDQRIDFMTIDVEGLDLEVLRSNNWSKYRPKIIVIEQLESDIQDVIDGPTYEFLHQKGYKLTSKFYNSTMYTSSR